MVYVTAMAGVVHYYWLVKSDVRRPLMYGAMFGLLLLFRAGLWLMNLHADASASGAGKELTTAEMP